MLNSQIFDHVNNKDLRLSIAKLRQHLDSFLLESFKLEIKKNIQLHYLKLNTLKRKDCPEYLKQGLEPSFLQNKIREYKNELKIIKEQIFLQRKFEHLMFKHEWKEFDCSDYISDYSTTTYVPFIGSEDEFNQLKEILNVK